MTRAPADFDWEDAYARFVAYVARRIGRLGLGRGVEAEDIVQEAFRQALSPAYKAWNPATQPDFKDYLGSRVNGVLQNARKRKSEAIVAGAVEDTASDFFDPTESAGDIGTSDKVGGLLERLGDDPECLTVVMAMADGCASPREIAAETGLPIDVVYNSNRRLARHRDAVLQSLCKKDPS